MGVSHPLPIKCDASLRFLVKKISEKKDHEVSKVLLVVT